MKVLVVIVLALGLSSCDDDEHSNSFSVEVNGNRWKGTTQIKIICADTISILGVIPEPEGVIWMKIKFQGTGEYSLLPTGGYYSTIGRDTQVSDYRLDPDMPGKLIITEYYPPLGLVKGTFEMNVKEIWAAPVTSFNILNFRKGNFEGRIRR